MELLHTKDVVPRDDAQRVFKVDTTKVILVGLFLGMLPLAILTSVAFLAEVSPRLLLLAGFPAAILALTVHHIRYPRRPAPQQWRAAIAPDGVYVRLDTPLSGKSVLHIALDEIHAAQRCDRGGIGGGAYLDIHVAPETLANLPARPLIIAPALGQLNHAGYVVSWGRGRVHIALQASPLEKAPEVEQALQALDHLNVTILNRRSEFWPGGTLGLNADPQSNQNTIPTTST